VSDDAPGRTGYVIHPWLDRVPPIAVRGEGLYLYDEEGRRYLDGCSGAVSSNIGHGVPEVLEAMHAQAQRLTFAFRSQFGNRPAEALAERLGALAPGSLRWLFLVNSGSEATELAAKMALQHWQERGRPEKTHVLSRRISYHGITLGALSMSGHALRRSRFEALLAKDAGVATPYCLRCPLSLAYPSCELACADDLQTHIDALGADHVAAFIAEPVVGASGAAITPPHEYYARIRAICDANDVLFIADEVMTGMGRTGAMFAVEHYGVVPDLLVLGKGLGAGYTPVAAVMASDELMEPIRQGSGAVLYGHTLSFNPLSAATALAVLDYVEKHDLVRNARERGDQLMNALKTLAARHPVLGDVRGLGLLVGLELVADGSLAPFPPETNVTGRLVRHAFDRGLLIYPASGALEGAGDAVMIAPPLTIGAAEVDALVGMVDGAVGALERELGMAAPEPA
jgi:adenosylmethionine-8-amino-7-oxononanoate aminotransferase